MRREHELHRWQARATSLPRNGSGSVRVAPVGSSDSGSAADSGSKGAVLTMIVDGARSVTIVRVGAGG